MNQTCQRMEELQSRKQTRVLTQCFYFNGGNDAFNSKYVHSQVKEKSSLEANIHQRNDKTTAQTSVGSSQCQGSQVIAE